VNDGLNSAPNEFRFINNGLVAGNGEYSLVDGGSATPLAWVFDDVTGELLSVAGSDLTPGDNGLPNNNGALAISDVGLFKNIAYFGTAMGFLAPTLGGAAGNAYGVATINRTDLQNDGAFTIHFPGIEVQ